MRSIDFSSSSSLLFFSSPSFCYILVFHLLVLFVVVVVVVELIVVRSLCYFQALINLFLFVLFCSRLLARSSSLHFHFSTKMIDQFFVLSLSLKRFNPHIHKH